MPDARSSDAVDRELAQHKIAPDRTQHYRWKRRRHRLSRAWRPIHRPRYGNLVILAAHFGSGGEAPVAPMLSIPVFVAALG